MDVALVGVAGSILGTILGVWLGSKLTQRAAKEATREQREWQEGQTIRQRKDAAAEALREAVIEAQGVVPQATMDLKDAFEPLMKGYQALREAWTRASLLKDEGIERRFSALDMALFIGLQDTRGRGNESINFWGLGVALVDLRVALDAYLRHEPYPPAVFPTSKELIEIAGSTGIGTERIRRSLMEDERARLIG